MPPVPLATLAICKVSPSTSVSLPSNCRAVKVIGVSSVALRVSATATGTSLTGLTVTVTLAAALLSMPSLIT